MQRNELSCRTLGINLCPIVYRRTAAHFRKGETMKCLSIQINSDAIAQFDTPEFLKRVRAIGRSPEVDAFEERGKAYLNFNFFTEMPQVLWQELTDNIYGDESYGPYLRGISIAACEGEDRDEDLLLHHFDPSERLDKF
jgi:hypothetical protein